MCYQTTFEILKHICVIKQLDCVQVVKPRVYSNTIEYVVTIYIEALPHIKKYYETWGINGTSIMRYNCSSLQAKRIHWPVTQVCSAGGIGKHNDQTTRLWSSS